MPLRDVLLMSLLLGVALPTWADGVLNSLTTSSSEISGSAVQDQGFDRSTELEGSFSGHLGLAHINQSAGELTHQANLRSIAIGAGAIGAADVEIESSIAGNQLQVEGGQRGNVITGSFADTRGIVGVNQASGIATTQTNSLALSVDVVSRSAITTTPPRPDGASIDGVASVFVDVGAEALDDQALEELVSGNEIQSDVGLPRHERLTDSFSGFRGIAQVSQSAGDLNQVSNRAAISVITVAP